MKFFYQKSILLFLTLFYYSFLPCISFAIEVPINLFSIENYDQNVKTWLSPNNPDYTKPLLEKNLQKQYFENFLIHYFSPWHKEEINKIFKKDGNILSLEKRLLTQFNNHNKTPNKIGYGINFRPYSPQWINTLTDNMNLFQFSHLKFNPQRRAMIVNNTYLRALPTNDPFFYRLDIPGQGYPFDNLQSAAVWVGSPVYIIGQTQNHAWSLIIASNLIGWVESINVAKANEHFAQRWESLSHQQLITITHTDTPIKDPQSGTFLATAYIGAIFPVTGQTNDQWKIGFPTHDKFGEAYVDVALIPKQDAHIMPLEVTQKNFAMLFKQLQNRPYGWGGINFYNDCSSELKNLFTPFGIWLPYNSSQQAHIGKKINLSALSVQDRIDYLAKNGHPLMTLVYVNGHIFLYVGNYANAYDTKKSLMPLTYQNVWALKNKDHSNDSRFIIGQSVFLPLLAAYPDTSEAETQAARSIFQLNYLDVN